MSSSKRKILFRLSFWLLLLFFILVILQTKFNLIGPQESISEYKKNELIKLGLVALKNGDVPVKIIKNLHTHLYNCFKVFQSIKKTN